MLSRWEFRTSGGTSGWVTLNTQCEPGEILRPLGLQKGGEMTCQSIYTSALQMDRRGSPPGSLSNINTVFKGEKTGKQVVRFAVGCKLCSIQEWGRSAGRKETSRWMAETFKMERKLTVNSMCSSSFLVRWNWELAYQQEPDRAEEAEGWRSHEEVHLVQRFGLEGRLWASWRPDSLLLAPCSS